VLFQISELNHVNLPVMLMPDDFKAFTKIRVDNHMFNKLVFFVDYCCWLCCECFGFACAQRSKKDVKKI